MIHSELVNNGHEQLRNNSIIFYTIFYNEDDDLLPVYMTLDNNYDKDLNKAVMFKSSYEAVDELFKRGNIKSRSYYICQITYQVLKTYISSYISLINVINIKEEMDKRKLNLL